YLHCLLTELHAVCYGALVLLPQDVLPPSALLPRTAMRSHHDGPEAKQLAALTRRRMLQVGLLGGLGLTLPQVLRQEARGETNTFARARSVIFLWLQGGVSHHETFDMKPDAPAEVRGQFRPIQTNLPGVVVGEHLVQLAKMMDRLAVIRSVTHGE